MTFLWAEQALTAAGWENSVLVEIGADGRIEAVTAGAPARGQRVGILLPAPANLHSHAFQRAMAGMTERRGPDRNDSFWTWRKLMYRFLDRLTPDDVEATAAFVQMEMLEAGYAAVCEFHYLHHRPDGRPYDDIAEMSGRIAAAAATTGIGLTLLPVLYRFGGCDRRPLGAGQMRFGNDQNRFARLFEKAGEALNSLPDDVHIGIAPHSLRAVAPDDIAFAMQLAPQAPFHIHLAEQTGEVDEVRHHLGARPVEWMLANHAAGGNWCFIHCTQMEAGETEKLAASGVVAGLCPITESSLGDGIFDGSRFVSRGGRFGIGSDSNIRISLNEELRTFEYSQRLRDRARAVLARSDASTGRVLFEGMAAGGAQAAGRYSGSIEHGKLADLVALDSDAVDLAEKYGDEVLDSFVFAGNGRMVTHVWSAGRHVVNGGQHVKHDEITRRYRATISNLRDAL